jgi:hypothetical protein
MYVIWNGFLWAALKGLHDVLPAPASGGAHTDPSGLEPRDATNLPRTRCAEARRSLTTAVAPQAVRATAAEPR